MKSIFEAFKRALSPQRCAYCGRVISAQKLMCAECEKILPRIKKETCRKCGREKEFCFCNGENYHSGTVAPFYFEGVVRKGMHAYKFRKSPQNYEAYAEETAKAVKGKFGEIKFDFILPVPMTKKSVSKRGYNQVELLADKIGELISVECRKDILVKLYETEAQHGLSYIYRKGNLLGVFDVSDGDAVKDKTVLLCDDISTSGETFNECAKMLWLYGAKEIYCTATALTKPKKKAEK